MPFTFGAVFSRFFRLIGENATLFLGLFVVLNLLPGLAVGYGLFSEGGLSLFNWPRHAFDFGTLQWTMLGGASVGLWLLGLLNMAMVTEVAILRGVGRPVSIPAVLGHSLINILPIFIISLMVGVVTVLGCILFIVPGVMFAVAASVAIPAYIGQSGTGLWGSVRRSFDLTRGNRWTIFALYLVVGLAGGVVSSAFTAAITGLPNPADPNLSNIMTQSVLRSLTQFLGYIFTAAIYVCLRHSQEGANPDSAAEVF